MDFEDPHCLPYIAWVAQPKQIAIFYLGLCISCKIVYICMKGKNNGLKERKNIWNVVFHCCCDTVLCKLFVKR